MVHAGHAAHVLPLLLVSGPALVVAWRGVRTTPRSRAAQLVTASALLAAAAVHVAAAQQHLGLQRVFFVLVVAVQAGLAVAVLQRPTRMTAVLVVLSSAGLLALWLESRTVGLGYGLEAVGPVDVAAKVLELTAMLAARWMDGPQSRPTRVDGEVAAWGLIVVAGALAATV